MADLNAPLCGLTGSSCILSQPLECENCNNELPVMIFPLLALIGGILLTPLTKVTKIPYTIVLILLGVLFGVLGCAVRMSYFTQSLQLWVHLNPPSIFLYVFLSPLVFEASFNAHAHKFVRLVFPIVFLAFAMAIAQCFIIAVFLVYVIRTPDWTLFSGLVYGAMLAATDPISVTATLREVGASEALNTLIEGESLLNDGSAVVFFQAFFLKAIGEDVSGGEIVKSLFKLSLGGFAFGLLFGFGSLFALAWLYESFEVEVTITMIVAFLGFWVAQAPAQTSGVIANVTSGVILGLYGKDLVSPSVRDPLRMIWSLLAWVANTIVFTYAGLLVVAYIWSCSGGLLRWYDYVHIITWCAFLTALRFVLVFASYWILKWRQRWLGWRETFLVAFSGLRGGVALILMLQVGNTRELPVLVRATTVLWVSAFVFYSLAVFGGLNKQLVSLLKLDAVVPERQEFLWRARGHLLAYTLSTLDFICTESSFKAAHWSVVTKTVLPEVWLNNLDDAVAALKRSSMEHKGEVPKHTFSRQSLDRSAGAAPLSLAFGGSTGDVGHDHQDNAEERAPSGVDTAAASAGASHADDEESGGKDTLQREHKMLRSFFNATVSAHVTLGTERDAEVRRRMLYALLHTVREGYETQMVDFFPVQRVCNDLRMAIDANEIGERYELFSFISRERTKLRRRLSGVWGVRHLIRAFDRLVLRREWSAVLGLRPPREARIQMVTVVATALGAVLREPYLAQSALVRREVQQLYVSSVKFLNDMEALDPVGYERSHTSAAIGYTFRRQLLNLDEMQDSGVIDREEHEALREELVSQQRQYVLFASRKRPPPRPAMTLFLRRHPLFHTLDNRTFGSMLEQGGGWLLKLRCGEALDVPVGCVVVVRSGGLRLKDSSCPLVASMTGYDFHPHPVMDDVLSQERRPAGVKLVGESKSDSRDARRANGSAESNGAAADAAAQSNKWVHLCFGRYSVLCAPDLLHSPLSPLPTLLACEVHDTTEVLVLPMQPLQRLVLEVGDFRTELARNIARLVVTRLMTLPAAAAADDGVLVGAEENGVPAAAPGAPGIKLTVALVTEVLSALPYTSLISFEGRRRGAMIQGPGVLLSGAVLVKGLEEEEVKEGATEQSEDISDVNSDDVGPLHTHHAPRLRASHDVKRYVAPAVLPMGLLRAELEGGVLGGEHGAASAELMAMVPMSHEHLVGQRLLRWQCEPLRADANGRFGLNMHMDRSRERDHGIEASGDAAAKEKPRPFGE